MASAAIAVGGSPVLTVGSEWVYHEVGPLSWGRRPPTGRPARSCVWSSRSTIWAHPSSWRTQVSFLSPASWAIAPVLERRGGLASRDITSSGVRTTLSRRPPDSARSRLDTQAASVAHTPESGRCELRPSRAHPFKWRLAVVRLLFRWPLLPPDGASSPPRRLRPRASWAAAGGPAP